MTHWSFESTLLLRSLCIITIISRLENKVNVQTMTCWDSWSNNVLSTFTIMHWFWLINSQLIDGKLIPIMVNYKRACEIHTNCILWIFGVGVNFLLVHFLLTKGDQICRQRCCPVVHILLKYQSTETFVVHNLLFFFCLYELLYTLQETL